MYSITQCVRTISKWDHTHHADQSNIFYAHRPIREVLLTLRIRQYKIKYISYSWEQDREVLKLCFKQMLKKRRQKTEMPGANSHWRYNTISALLPSLSARLQPQLQPALQLHQLGTSEEHPHPGNGNWLLVFFFKLKAPVCGVCIYLSVRLLVKKKDGKVIWRFRPLWGLSWCGSYWLWMMYGSHTRGFELGKVEAKFVLYPCKGGCSQAVSSNVFRVDGRKLWDARLGGGLRTYRTTADRREGGERNGNYTNVTAFLIYT